MSEEQLANDQVSQDNRELIHQAGRLQAEQRRISLYRYLANILQIIVVIAALVVMFVTLGQKSDDADRASVQNAVLQDQITELQQQLAVASAHTAQFRQDESDKTNCVARYDHSVQAATAAVWSALGDLVVTLSTELPSDARTQKLIAEATEVQTARDALKTAITDGDQYILDGKPLPCPLADAPLPPAGQ